MREFEGLLPSRLLHWEAEGFFLCSWGWGYGWGWGSFWSRFIVRGG